MVLSMTSRLRPSIPFTSGLMSIHTLLLSTELLLELLNLVEAGKLMQVHHGMALRLLRKLNIGRSALGPKVTGVVVHRVQAGANHRAREEDDGDAKFAQLIRGQSRRRSGLIVEDKSPLHPL